MALTFSVIIPAFNEADIIADTLRGVLAIQGVSEVIVVDDHSSDNTAEIARASGASQVVVLDKNRGKGGAMNESLAYASGDILLLLDGDLGVSASEGERLLQPVLSGEADMAVAVFGKLPTKVTNSGDTHLAARSGGFGMVMKTARTGIRLLTGKTVVAPLSGPRALKREIIDKCGGFADKFGVEVALTVDALRLGYRMVEVPVTMVHRPSGRDFKGFMHRGRQLMHVLRTLARKAFT